MSAPHMTAIVRPVPARGERDRCRGCVRAAILLVAETRYPSVAVANIHEAGALAAELGPEARVHGVSLAVSEDTVLPDSEIVVHRS